MKKVKILLSVTMLFFWYSRASDGGCQGKEEDLAMASSALGIPAAVERTVGEPTRMPLSKIRGMQDVLDALARNASSPLPGQEGVDVTGSRLMRAMWRGNGVEGTHPTAEGRQLTDDEIAEANQKRAVKDAAYRQGTPSQVHQQTSYLNFPGAGSGSSGSYRTGMLPNRK